MSGASIVLIASLAILGDGEVTLEPSLDAVLRPGDEGVAFYELLVNNVTQVVEVGRVIVRSDDRGTTLALEPGAESRPGLKARFELPVERLSLDELARLSGKSQELDLLLRNGGAARNESVAPAEDETPPVAAAVATRIEAWADAWRRQNVDDYLSFYSRDFRPGDGSSVEDWRRRRRQQITAPEFVELDLGAIDSAPLDEDRAAARFIQTFRSNLYADSVRKRLVLVLERGEWRIVEETVEEQWSADAEPEL